MMSVGRHLMALLAAVAVFVVGTTCTRAGCVIPAQPIRAAAEEHCCAGRADRNSSDESNHEAPKSCPACEHPMFAGNGVTATKTVGHGPHALDAPALFLAPLFIATVSPVARGAADLPLYDDPPPNDRATRLALSCALLN